MRLVLSLLLTLAAAPAWAEWVKVTENDKATFYIDLATIRKDGGFSKVWAIQDMKQRDKGGSMSWRALFEYDCKDERYRVLSSTTHSEAMAQGSVAQGNVVGPINTPNSLWEYIPPGIPAEKALRIVCAK